MKTLGDCLIEINEGEPLPVKCSGCGVIYPIELGIKRSPCPNCGIENIHELCDSWEWVGPKEVP